MQKTSSAATAEARAPKGLHATPIAFIGAGAMAEAMISGLLNSHVVSSDSLTASHPKEQRCQDLRTRFGLIATTDNREAARNAEVVILCVKPQMLRMVFRDLRGAVKPSALVLSIVAGVRLESIAQGLRHQRLVRSMPLRFTSTPAHSLPTVRSSGWARRWESRRKNFTRGVRWD